MSVKFSVDVYPEYDAYVRIRPSVLIDLSTARRKEETGGRGRERAPLDLFSRTLSRRISAFYIRVVAIGREKFTLPFSINSWNLRRRGAKTFDFYKLSRDCSTRRGEGSRRG